MAHANGLRSDPPGAMIEVAGRQTHIVRAGQGAPTVVLEAGMGSMSSQWAWVQPGIARFARVCSYDRPGAGWSEAAVGPRDALHVAADLLALLKAAGEPAPYVLVGHSLGGVFARVFAARYPESVVGLVLVDPTPLDLRLGWSNKLQAWAMTESLPILFRLGFQPLRAQMEPMGRDLPNTAREDLIGSYGSLAHLVAFRDEYRAMASSNAQAKAATLRRDLPVTVLSADLSMVARQADMVRRTQAEHARFAADFAGSRHRVIPGSNHLSLVTDPKSADQIVEEVRRLVERVRPARSGGSPT